MWVTKNDINAQIFFPIFERLNTDGMLYMETCLVIRVGKMTKFGSFHMHLMCSS